MGITTKVIVASLAMVAAAPAVMAQSAPPGHVQQRIQALTPEMRAQIEAARANGATRPANVVRGQRPDGVGQRPAGIQPGQRPDGIGQRPAGVQRGQRPAGVGGRPRG